MLFMLWCYGSKFLPTVITVIFSQSVSFLTLCPIYMPQNSKCLYIYPDPRDQFWGGWGSRPIVVLVVQHFALTLIVLHFGKTNLRYFFYYIINILAYCAKNLVIICQILLLKTKSLSLFIFQFVNQTSFCLALKFIILFYLVFFQNFLIPL